ncbi:MAG: methylated-DNA--[protein]-cysteine S-methyltransferase [Verrucomicrobiaceae bacterium]|nr:MAG: methylated-DNA--[protein]-cysteine S-methyltransferase [Verrucomicrobiaceae bacterium]
MTTQYTHHDTPVGRLLIQGTANGLSGLWILGEKHAPSVAPEWRRNDGAFPEIRSQLDEYFAGARTEFDVPLAVEEGTEFQRSVWAALLRIPCGLTKTYGQLAEEIGNPKAVRAVGLANGRNPVSIIVPCHRVIGANGALTGYGGGLKAKSWLLHHEQRLKPLAGLMGWHQPASGGSRQ